MADLKKLETLAQRGLSNKEIRIALRIEELTKADMETIERGRATGIALINDKLFKRAMAGEPKAVEYLNKKFASMTPDPEPESYMDQQLRILRSLKL